MCSVPSGFRTCMRALRRKQQSSATHGTHASFTFAVSSYPADARNIVLDDEFPPGLSTLTRTMVTTMQIETGHTTPVMSSPRLSKMLSSGLIGLVQAASPCVAAAAASAREDMAATVNDKRALVSV